MPNLFDPGINRTAEISPCGKYRYRLARVWDAGGKVLVWCMLNPSTADGLVDDPTIRRCMAFSRGWGYTGLIVANLFAWRATKPADIPTLAAAVGPENDRHIAEAADGRHVIAAWGAIKPAHAERARQVLQLLRGSAASVSCLKLTDAGQPRHPLYVRGDTKPMPFGAEVARA